MELATNAILAAVLVQASAFVTDLDIPLETPLVESKVKAFNSYTNWSRNGPELACYLGYAGGYEFRHLHGCIMSFDTLDAYTRMQNPKDLVKLLGEFRYTQEECLAKAKDAFRRLGYTNLTFMADEPDVVTPTFTRGGRKIPRYIFRWPMRNDAARRMSEAEVEVNASRLTIEDLRLFSPEFWRESWPITFGTTNVYEEPDPIAPTRAGLEVRDVSREYALAFIRAVLPQISEFCAKLGPSIPSRVEETDIVMGGSEVAIKKGRLSASLRLKSGYLVVFHAGHVWAVHAKDVSYNHPTRRKYFKDSSEYRDPTKLSKEDAATKVRQILVERLALPEQPLFLDTEPVFAGTWDPAMTNALRRYVFHWQRPETAEQRDERLKNQVLPEVSVSAEVDAVSGEIKAINFLHKWFERPDPSFEFEGKADAIRK